MGLAEETLFRKVDLPALGKPTSPTSAKDFNSSLINLTSPSNPSVNFLGAWLVLDLKRALP